jgi:DNA-3-methyladenine glycosylase I
MLRYHDREWGVPVHDDRKHFGSGARRGAGRLSWSTVLNKRKAIAGPSALRSTEGGAILQKTR